MESEALRIVPNNSNSVDAQCSHNTNTTKAKNKPMIIVNNAEAPKKYNLRIKSLPNRIETHLPSRRNVSSKGSIAKQKPPPLSKYRRKTANLRERCRMQEINDAFQRLQSVVPNIFCIADNPKSNSQSMAKLTKINTLKLAVNYISALTQILKQSDDNSLHNNSSATSHGHLHHGYCDQDENNQPKETSIISAGSVNNIENNAAASIPTTTTIVHHYSRNDCNQFQFVNTNNYQIKANQTHMQNTNGNSLNNYFNLEYSFSNGSIINNNTNLILDNNNTFNINENIDKCKTANQNIDNWRPIVDENDSNIETIFEDLDSLLKDYCS